VSIAVAAVVAAALAAAYNASVDNGTIIPDHDSVRINTERLIFILTERAVRIRTMRELR
jgi:hypothetical protein